MSDSQNEATVDRFEDAAARILSDELPIPVRERWQPLRLGLMNLFLFEDERFPFADGGLLLRGSNGAGKSRVLAMTLPLLLDGSLKATRVEPDRDSNRQVAWNVLMDRQQSATGYSWLEFGRIDEDGSDRFVTIGCGMRAKRGQPIKSWFFITEHRVDETLNLKASDDVPLTRRKLVEAIGERGQVFESASEYRRVVDATFFQLGERYDALIDLLLQLRQPQLAKKLDIEQLEMALRESLPPLPESLLDDAAEAFRDLDQYRGSLESDRQTLKNVERFLKPYREHVSRGVKRALKNLTSANSQYEQVQRSLRQLANEEAAKKAELEVTEREQRNIRIDIESGRAAIGELRQSPEMRTATRLDECSQKVNGLVEQEADSVKRLHDAEEELNSINQVTSELNTRVDKIRAATITNCAESRATASPEELQNIHDDQITRLLEQNREADYDSARHKITSVARRFQNSARHLEELNQQFESIRTRLVDAEREVVRCEATCNEASETLSHAKQRLRESRVKIWESILEWRNTATPLLSKHFPSMSQWSDQWHAWDANSRDADPSPPLVDKAKMSALNELTIQKERLEQAIDEAESRIGVLKTEREQRLAGELIAPPTRSHRGTHSGDETAGVPFWSLVEFKHTVPDHEQGNWESALHDAGVLDALLTEDGSLVSSQSGEEIHFVAAGLPALEPDRQLAQALMLDGETSLHLPSAKLTETLNRALAGIGVGSGAGRIWVANDGRWQNGPLHGKLTKCQPQYIGKQARDRWREHRLGEIELEIEQILAKQTEFQAGIARVVEQEIEIQHDASAFPSSEALVNANGHEQVAQQASDQANDKLRQWKANEAEIRQELEIAQDKRDADATDMGLSAWGDRAEDLGLRLERYLLSLQALDAKVESLVTVVQQADQHRISQTRAANRKQQTAAWLDQIQIDLVKARETLNVLQSSAGKSVTEIMDRLEAAEKDQNDRETKASELIEQHADIKAALAVYDSNKNRFEADSEKLDSERREATDWFSTLHENSLLGLILDSEQIPELPWSMTAAIKLARIADLQLKDVPTDSESWQRSQSKLNNAQNELQQTVVSQDGLAVELEHFRDGLLVVNLTLQGDRMSPAKAVLRLNADIQNREQILDAREQDTLEKYLLGEVAEGLRTGMRMAAELVETMTREVSQRPMKTGMQMRFKWRRDEDGPVGLAEACEVLETDSSTWSTTEREEIKQFLQRSIRDQRDNEETGSWLEHMRAALDYRLWHRIIIERRSGPDANWQRLTRRTYGSGSGGEKAIALTLPQLAAAAAYYQSADKLAPRFILLDEAFAGISSDMRESCMELISAFKLDVVMTSESEWGMYAGVKQLAICQLDRFADIDAVVNRVFIWNGAELRESTSKSEAAEIESQPLFSEES